MMYFIVYVAWSCSFSRHSYIADYSQSDVLPDGSPCWKDYSQSRNNRYENAIVLFYCDTSLSLSLSRFMTAEGTSKNRIVAPGQIMHFYNSPPDSSEETLKSVR